MPVRSTAPDGKVTLAMAETPAARPDVPRPASLITPQWRVEQALRLRLAERGGAVELDAALEGFEQCGDGVTAVVLKGGEHESVTADWLVGCDGGHSVVRKRAGIAFEGETREAVRIVVADVEVDGLERDAWHTWRHEEGLVNLCPLPSTEAFQHQASISPARTPGSAWPTCRRSWTGAAVAATYASTSRSGPCCGEPTSASTTQPSVSYRGSPLVSDDRGEGAFLRAGDRAPDASGLSTLDGQRRLFELTRGGRFTLLTLRATPAVDASPSDLETVRVVARPSGPDDVADTGGHLASAYDATDDTLVLVRPDGYVALISDTGDVSAVSDHLAHEARGVTP